MSNVIDYNKRFDNIRLAELEYFEKSNKHILEDMNFYSNDDKLLCGDIINHLEKTAAEEIQNNKCVQLPFVGSIRKNPLKKTLDEHREKFTIAKKCLNKEDFKEYTSDVFRKRKEELRKEDYIKVKYREIKNKYKRKYELFYTQIGPAYANMFIKSVMMFDIVHFDEEFEEQYNILNNG